MVVQNTRRSVLVTRFQLILVLFFYYLLDIRSNHIKVVISRYNFYLSMSQTQ